MKLTGKVWKYGADIDTDVIIPARYLYTADPEEMAQHCLEDLEPGFYKKIAQGDIVVADKNFGCGSSREHAPIALKAAGVSCVIAKTFARIFYRNAMNMGMPIFECPEAVDGIKAGDQVEVDVKSGLIKNITTGQTYQAAPFPEFMQQLMDQGGLINYVKGRVKKRA